jgi:hypothetical protein
LHGYEKPTSVADIDLVFFDATDLTEEHGLGQQREMRPEIIKLELDLVDVDYRLST